MSDAITATTPLDLEAASVLHAAAAEAYRLHALLDQAPAGNAAASEIVICHTMLIELRHRLVNAVMQLTPDWYANGPAH